MGHRFCFALKFTNELKTGENSGIIMWQLRQTVFRFFFFCSIRTSLVNIILTDSEVHYLAGFVWGLCSDLRHVAYQELTAVCTTPRQSHKRLKRRFAAIASARHGSKVRRRSTIKRRQHRRYAAIMVLYISVAAVRIDYIDVQMVDFAVPAWQFWTAYLFPAVKYRG